MATVKCSLGLSPRMTDAKLEYITTDELGYACSKLRSYCMQLSWTARKARVLFSAFFVKEYFPVRIF